jgi:hypothetical protein
MNNKILWEEKNSTEPKPNFVNKSESEMNDITKNTEIESKKNVCENTGKIWKRNCPKCGKDISYSTKYVLIRAIKRNSFCSFCKGENISKSLIGKPSKIKGIPFTKEHKDRISKALKGIIRSEESCQKMSNSKKGKKASVESRIKRRINRIKDLSHLKKYNPVYNKTACEYFKQLELKIGWDGYYATKNGEYHIKDLDYWVDYYEPSKNIVIEWDERHHYKGGKLREWDVKRQEEIVKHLGCSFYRINELTNDGDMLKFEIK